MRALVTGANGFVGRYLANYLLDCGDTVLGSYFRPHEEPPRFEAVSLNVTDFDPTYQLIKKFEPEVIYHLAAISFVPEAEENFSSTLVVNVGGVNNIIRSCHLLENNAKVVNVSSAEVYGRIKPEYLPLGESTPLNPANNYSLSKRMAELIGPRYEQFGKVRTVTLRPFNHIGPGQNNRFVASSFAFQLAQIAKGKSEPVIRVGNLEAKRDFTDVRDIVRAYRLAAEKGSGVYNLGSEIAAPIQYILDRLIEVSGLDVKVEQDPSRMRPSEVPEIRADITRARTELGWEPELPISQTLADIYQYWLERV